VDYSISEEFAYTFFEHGRCKSNRKIAEACYTEPFSLVNLLLPDVPFISELGW